MKTTKLLYFALIVSQSWCQEQVLKSLIVTNKSRLKNAGKIKREQNIDYITDEKGNEIGYCHLILFSKLDYGGVSSFALAVDHLNRGGGNVISAVEGLNERCNIRFTTEVLDTEGDPKIAVKELMNILRRDPEIGQQLPCAFIGAAYSSVSRPTSMITGIHEYPQFSYSSTSLTLDDKSQYPLFGRMVPSDGNVTHILKLFRDQFNIQHICIIYANDAYGIAYLNAVNRALVQYPDIEIKAFQIPANNPDPDVIIRIVTELRETRYRYFFGIIFSSTYTALMVEAHKQGIAGTGLHTWLFADGLDGFDMSAYERDSDIYNAAKGAATIMAMGGMPNISSVFDNYSEAWRRMNNYNDIAYMNFMMRNVLKKNVSFDSKIFESSVGGYDTYLYDSVISIGLAACDLSSAGRRFTGTQHYNAVLNTSFTGASGNIELDPTTGTRIPSSALFVVKNIVENEQFSDGLSSVQSLYLQDKEWKIRVPYIFNDGSTTPPNDLPEVSFTFNRMSIYIRCICLIMAAQIVFLSVAFAFWTYYYSQTPVVKAAQPIFLYIICAGTLLMGLSMFVLTIDGDTAGTFSCMSMEWFRHLGFTITFAAFFTKTRRVNKIFHNPNKFKRMKVTVHEMLKPLVTLLIATTAILVAWTAISPLEWRTNIEKYDEFGRPNQEYGYCWCGNTAWFILPIMLVELGCLLWSIHEAYAARSISIEFAESDYIFRALASILVVALVGIPVLILESGTGSDTVALINAVISYVVSMSVLLFMFVPKVMRRNDIATVPSNQAIHSTSVGGRSGRRKTTISGLQG